ncbi:hypothetical protein AGMMS4956_04390 [Bacteroidia bacterium]|nr:hypothetical protein AGMMS4956_04390 [Bacteroidia bacterium]
MKKEKMYTFQKWERWSHAIASAMEDFWNTFHLQPGILEASEHTLSQFDYLTNINPQDRKNAHRDKGYTPPRLTGRALEEEIKLYGYSKTGIDLDFAVDEQLADMMFRLVYDDDAEWEEDDKITPEVPDFDEREDKNVSHFVGDKVSKKVFAEHKERIAHVYA